MRIVGVGAPQQHTRREPRVVHIDPERSPLLLDGVPNAVGLAEITAMPHHMELPAMGTIVTGEVVWHTDHNRQVKIRLDEWTMQG